MADHDAPLSPQDPGFEYRSYPFYLLSRASGRYNAAMEDALRPIGLDQARWRILLVLAQHDWLGTNEIAKTVVYKLSTTTRMVQRLERDGYVETRQSPKDGRIRTVAITQKGVRKVDDSRPMASEVLRRALGGVDKADLAAFARVLKTIDESLR